VKTDARDAELLARLLKLGEIVEVVVPTAAQAAARDLVRAPEDVRGDLMRARHRLSKLLLRNGIVYAGGRPGTGVHDTWMRGQRLDLPGRQLAFDAAYETMLLTVQRRDRLDAAITAMAENSDYTDLVHRLGCLRGISTLTGFGLAVEIGDWDPVHRRQHQRVPGPGAHRVTPPAGPVRRGRSPRPATATPAGR
jgi:transposase